jgi:hypothetical protein
MLSALAMHCGQTFATHYAKDRQLKRCESAQTLLSTDTNDDADAPLHSHMIDMSGTERMITALTLEAGITIHALLTGVTLGVVGGTSFVSFLIAVAFHQIFESFAVAVTGNYSYFYFLITRSDRGGIRTEKDAVDDAAVHACDARGHLHRHGPFAHLQRECRHGIVGPRNL